MDDELDSALNQVRMLRAQLRALQFQEEAPAPDPATKQQLHTWLDRLQSLTPEFLRAAVRPLYLNLFYYRFFPEHSHLPPPSPLPRENALQAWSGYAPFLEYKERVCRTLNMDYSGFGCDSVPGLVSVVLPVYNGARYVAASIESALAQSYRELELIVVDDGSTDETSRIVEQYLGDPRMRLIRQSNQKLPAALNAGFAQARGEFFTWTSDDNLMDPEMLGELAGFLRSNPDAEMVYADQVLIPEGIVDRRPRDPGPLSFLQKNYIGGCFLYRAWAGRAVGEYDPECFGFEDYDYWLRINALFRIAHLGKEAPLYSYRLHEGSLTAREKELRLADRTRYYLPLEEERRRFFAQSFDIALLGEHPWFPALGQAYRRAGHNVFEAVELTPGASYHRQVTRAYSKSIEVRSEQFQGDRFDWGGRRWRVGNMKDLEYPLLAIANAHLLRTR